MKKKNKIKILFLCTGNSCRSQMAEGFANHFKGDEIEAYSAGVDPYKMIPSTIQVMKEAQVDISNQYTKGIDEVDETEYDYIITLCDHAKNNCPTFPGHPKVVHVGFDDPYSLAMSAKSEKEALDHYRRIRDEIKVFIKKLPHSLAK